MTGHTDPLPPVEVNLIRGEMQEATFTSYLVARAITTALAVAGARRVAQLFDVKLSRWDAYKLIFGAAAVTSYVVPDRRAVPAVTMERIKGAIVGRLGKNTVKSMGEKPNLLDDDSLTELIKRYVPNWDTLPKAMRTRLLDTFKREMRGKFET